MRFVNIQELAAPLMKACNVVGTSTPALRASRKPSTAPQRWVAPTS
ncbi:MAG: hypothetical protein ABSA59_00860 [Terriglobia bacterium]|jgi:hypothetical protein